MDVILQLNENAMKLYILDNGMGCSSIVKGYGLTSMQKRIRDLDGRIVFGSDGESGFNIHAELPLHKGEV